MIRIVADSTCDLSKELIKKYDITIIPLNILLGEEEFLDGENIRHFWHEHCQFCWEKAYTDKACEFYCTEDFYYWICAECFHDFADQFHWNVKPVEDLLR